jgi:hypothetical protein
MGICTGTQARPKRGLDGLDSPREGGAIAIESRARDQARQPEFLGRRPDLFRGHLDAGDGVDGHNRGLGHPKRGLRVGQEVAHAGRVDDVDLLLVPLEVGSGRRRGYVCGRWLLRRSQ